MRAFRRNRRRFRLFFAATLCAAVIPIHSLADDKDTSNPTATAASEAPTNQEPQRRALPAPLDAIFPGTDYLGPTPLIGVPDTDPVYPLTKALWAVAPALKNARIKAYGWITRALASAPRTSQTSRSLTRSSPTESN